MVSGSRPRSISLEESTTSYGAPSTGLPASLKLRAYFFIFFFLLSFGLSANKSHTRTTNPTATAEIASHVPNLSMGPILTVCRGGVQESEAPFVEGNQAGL